MALTQALTQALTVALSGVFLNASLTSSLRQALNFKCLLNCTPERLARLLRRQGLRLEVALLEEDQTLELNHTTVNSQKAETENLTGVASRGRKLRNTSV